MLNLYSLEVFAVAIVNRCKQIKKTVAYKQVTSI